MLPRNRLHTLPSRFSNLFDDPFVARRPLDSSIGLPARPGYIDYVSSAIAESRENEQGITPTKNKGGRLRGSKDKILGGRKGRPLPRKGTGEITSQLHLPLNTILQEAYDKLSSSSRDSLHRAARMNLYNVSVDDEMLEKCLNCTYNNAECWIGRFDKDRHRVLTSTKCRRCTEKYIECV